MNRRQFIRKSLAASVSVAFTDPMATARAATGIPFAAETGDIFRTTPPRMAKNVANPLPSNAAIKPQPHPVSPPVSNLKPAINALNARHYGYGNGTSAQDAINRAIMAAVTVRDVIIPATGGQHLTGPIQMKSGVRVFCQDTLTSSSSTIIDFTNVNDAAWVGGVIHGSDPKGSQDGMNLTNAKRNHLVGFKIDNVGNKGISLAGHLKDGTAATNNYIAPVCINNCASGIGAGISLFGDGVQKNMVMGGGYTGNRIGITVNGAHYNVFQRCVTSGNWQAGIAIDGIVTGSGDGGRHNRFVSCTANNNGGSDDTYAGIYLGNGSSYNRFDYPVINGNSGCGIYTTSAEGTNCQGNLFIAAQCANNMEDGMRFSTAPGTQVYQPTIQNNKGRGLSFYVADRSILQGGTSRGNRGDGVIIMSGDCTVMRVTATGNGGYGINVASGGSSPVGNIIRNNNVAGNQQGGLQVPGGQAAVSNNSGS